MSPGAPRRVSLSELHPWGDSSPLEAWEDRLPSYVHVVAVYSVTNSGALLAQLTCGRKDPIATAFTGSERYFHVDAMVDSHDAFQVLLASFEQYESHLRAGAQTHFLTIRDGDIVGMTAATFKEQMEGKLGHGFTYHALAGDDECPATGQPPAPNAHFALADLTGGRKYLLCEGAFVDDLADLEGVLTTQCVE